MGITRLVKVTALASAIMVIGVAAAACGGNGGSSDSLIPQRATLVGSIDIGQFLDTFGLGLEQASQLLSSGPLGEIEGFGDIFDLEQFRSEGLFSDVSRADIFGEVSDAEDAEYFGALLHGNFDETALIAEIESVSGRGLEQRVYKGSNVYSPADGMDRFELSVLDNSIFALGIGGAINDIIDIRAGDTDPASGPLMDTINDLGGGIFGFALKVPQDIADETDLGSIPGFGDLPISLDFVSALNIVGLGGNLKDDSLDLVVTMDFTDREAAESLEGFISGIVSLASSFLSDPRTSELLDGLETDRDGSLLTINVRIPVADLAGLFGDLTSATSTESSSASASVPAPGTPAIGLLESAIGNPIPIAPTADHVAEGQRVEYRTTPPTSGDHWGRWADCGWYPDGLPDEVITHNLEHGNIVVSYNFTDPALVTDLRRVLAGVAQFETWGVARSYEKIPDGQIALSAWGRLGAFPGVAAEEIERFFEAFAGLLGPERIPC